MPLPVAPCLDVPAVKARASRSTNRRGARVDIANRRDGGVLFWILKLYGFAFLIGFTALGVVGVSILTYFLVVSPKPPDLSEYSKIAPGVSRMYAADGTLLGEFAKEWRELVPFEKVPKPLVNAFLAVEDHEFFEHRGIYFKGIARALWANVTAGDFAQGGSTITQQVAKQFIGGEKSLSRKGKEAVMARRLEATYSKRAILSVYLNHIYLGAGAWGVAAAAQRYFGKKLDELTLSESATIAGLAKAPTRFSPLSRPKLALERRNVVLDKMVMYGLASPADVAAAKQEPIVTKTYKEVFPDRMPYYSDYVKGYVEKKYKGLLVGGGITVETAAEPTWEAASYGNAYYGAHKQDHRQGWRGPEWRLDGEGRERLIARQRAMYGAGPLVPDKRYLAIVDTVESGGAEVIIGDRKFELPLRNMKWASKWEPGNAVNDIEIGSAKSALKPGDVIWVTREVRSRERYRQWYLKEGGNPAWLGKEDEQEWDGKNEVVELDQVPHPQNAIFTADHHTAYVQTMAGGSDYDRSEFNRVTQACRQPGSTYKPIYYSLGLHEGFGYDTVLNDVPVQIIDPVTGEVWAPENLNDTLDGDVTLEYALVFSKNIPSVDLFKRLGAEPVVAWARKLGITTKIFADDALALGASCSRITEMARAYTVFARNGRWWPKPAGQEKEWVFVRRILDRDGNTIEDNTVIGDPRLPGADRFDRIAAIGGIEAPLAIPERAAFLTQKLLAQEVKYGFQAVLRQTEMHAAGKTGTSSDTHDTWFIAFTPRFTTIVWIGDDEKKRAVGRKDAAYTTAVPLWTRYMYEAAKNYPNPEIPWAVPEGVNPKDRGDHSKGTHGPQMDLYYRHPKRPPAEGDEVPPPPV